MILLGVYFECFGHVKMTINTLLSSFAFEFGLLHVRQKFESVVFAS